MQLSIYNHVLYSLYPEEEVYGVIINATFLSNEPKRKKDGELYAGARDNEFKRLPARRPLANMEGWLHEVEELFDTVQRDYQRLEEAQIGDPVMKAFNRNTEACSDYGGCPFIDYCSVWNNPLQHADEPPVGMKVEHWDPRAADTVREVVTL